MDLARFVRRNAAELRRAFVGSLEDVTVGVWMM
jgi:hypothetical protein